jgi:hypothetical protein
MGHERVGFLPKTKRWNDLIRQMASVSSSEYPIALVSAQTLQNVRKRYETLFRDDAVKTAFTFLVAVSRACRYENPHAQLRDYGVSLPDQPTLLSVVKALHQQVPAHESSTEYGQLALSAAADAIGQWHKQHSLNQISLFQPSSELFESWRNLGRGAGFCELTRLYFGKLTERYLNYFLDRAASAVFPNIQQRELFQSEIRSHIDDVSKHAFETAKITQSFAAGWFNAHTQDKMPDVKEIDGFLSLAFGKLRDELRREGETK